MHTQTCANTSDEPDALTFALSHPDSQRLMKGERRSGERTLAQPSGISFELGPSNGNEPRRSAQ
jgi:hypothetical protein